jgi:hypothetical protein
MSSLGKKENGRISFFFLSFSFLFFSPKAEDRMSIRIKLCDILDPWPVESFPTDCKKMEPFLPTSQPQSFLHETAE